MTNKNSILKVLIKNSSVNYCQIRFKTTRIYGSVKDREINTNRLMKNKKDPLKREKLPTFDYGKVNLSRKRLYVFGSSVDGALGLESLFSSFLNSNSDKVWKEGRAMRYIHKPVRHTFGDLHLVNDIAVGHGFTILSLKSKSIEDDSKVCVFGTGCNYSSQIGYHANNPKSPLGTLVNFVPLSLPLTTKKPNVLAIAAGRAHSLISVQNEGVFTLGDNSSGQCGRSIVEDEEYFGSRVVHKIQQFKSNQGDDQIVSIASNYNTSFCITKDGKVFSFGDNNSGQLGSGSENFETWRAKQIFGDIKDEKIVKIVTSGISTLALSEKGELFSWGANENGHINPENKPSVIYEPKFVQLPNNIGKVTDIAIGDMFSFVLNERGNVYSWGQGRSLGLGPSTVRVQQPQIIPPPLFGRNEFNPEIKIVSISSGFSHSGAINSIGDLYIWGKNTQGCLGLGLKSEYLSFPLKVNLNGSVIKASMGIDHTVVLAKAL